MEKIIMSKEYIYKDLTSTEFTDLVNKELPISLIHNQDLVDRVCDRYPLLSKDKVAFAIKMIFSSIRDNLFIGNFFVFHSIIKRMYLGCFNTKLGYKFKVKISTPSGLK